MLQVCLDAEVMHRSNLHNLPMPMHLIWHFPPELCLHAMLASGQLQIPNISLACVVTTTVIIFRTVAICLLAQLVYCTAGMLGNALLGAPPGLGVLGLPTGPMGSAGAADKLQSGGGSAFADDSLSRSGMSSIGNASTISSAPSIAHSGSGLPFSGQLAAGALPFGWISMADPEGRLFYFNGLTGQAQWSSPGNL